FYHPSHDDYQRPGNCRRKIFRCLNVGCRVREINQEEVAKAFLQASKQPDPVVVCVTNHDHRDMTPEIVWLKENFDKASRESGIPWKSASIDDTFGEKDRPAVRREWQWEGNDSEATLRIHYSSPIFGPQPFLAIKLINEIYHHV